MRFEWDKEKDAANQRKHRVSFKLAQQVFSDPFHLTIQDRYVEGEERWQSIGMVGAITVLLVASTFTEDNGEEVIRIISARKATRRERHLYGQQD